MAVTSSGNAWAVGYYSNPSETHSRTLIEHWKGTAWMVQASPSPGGSGYSWLSGVAATSPTNAWAVGGYGKKGASTGHGLIVHWNGKAWTGPGEPEPGRVQRRWALRRGRHLLDQRLGGGRLPVPQRHLGHLEAPDRALEWQGVDSPGEPEPGRLQQQRALGRGCHLVPQRLGRGRLRVPQRQLGHREDPHRALERQGLEGSSEPDPAILPGPIDPALRRGRHVRHQRLGGGGRRRHPQPRARPLNPEHTLIEHWNGRGWTVQASPNPGEPFGSELYDVAATSSTNAWAVGENYDVNDAALIEHWNGSAWTPQASPNPGGTLSGVAAKSSTNIWAVGNYFNGTADETLALHCG